MAVVLHPRSTAYADEQLGKKLKTAFTKIEQDADHIKLIAARQEQIGDFQEDSEALISIKPGFLELISSSDIVLKGKNIELDGNTTITDGFTLSVGTLAGWKISEKELTTNNGAVIVQYSQDKSGYSNAMRIIDGKGIFGRYNANTGEQFVENHGYVDISAEGLYSASPSASGNGNFFRFNTNDASIQFYPKSYDIFGSMRMIKGNINMVESNIIIDPNYYILSSSKASSSGNNISLLGLSSSRNLYVGMYYFGSSHHPEYISNIILSAMTTQALGTFKTSDGTVVNSDKRFKKDISDISDNEVDFILGLTPKKYKLIYGTSNRYHYGFVAQDVAELMDNTIGDSGILIKGEIKPKEDDDYTPVDFADENTFRYGLRYDEFIAPMIKTIQYLQKEIESLSNKISTMENK